MSRSLDSEVRRRDFGQREGTGTGLLLGKSTGHTEARRGAGRTHYKPWDAAQDVSQENKQSHQTWRPSDRQAVIREAPLVAPWVRMARWRDNRRACVDNDGGRREDRWWHWSVFSHFSPLTFGLFFLLYLVLRIINLAQTWAKGKTEIKQAVGKLFNLAQQPFWINFPIVNTFVNTEKLFIFHPANTCRVLSMCQHCSGCWETSGNRGGNRSPKMLENVSSCIRGGRQTSAKSNRSTTQHVRRWLP